MAAFLETAILIKTPPQRVWEILTDFPRMAEWNPFLPSILGAPVQGSRLTVTIVPVGKAAMVIKPRVLVATPGRELRWRGQLFLPGIFDGEHYFTIEPEGEGGSRLRHGERFSGLLVPIVMNSGLMTATRAGFDAMNAALKKRA